MDDRSGVQQSAVGVDVVDEGDEGEEGIKARRVVPRVAEHDEVAVGGAKRGDEPHVAVLVVDPRREAAGAGRADDAAVDGDRCR